MTHEGTAGIGAQHSSSSTAAAAQHSSTAQHSTAQHSRDRSQETLLETGFHHQPVRNVTENEIWIKHPNKCYFDNLPQRSSSRTWRWWIQPSQGAKRARALVPTAVISSTRFTFSKSKLNQLNQHILMAYMALFLFALHYCMVHRVSPNINKLSESCGQF